VPAHAEVLGDIADRRAVDQRASVVPADGCSRWMLAAVVAVAGFRRGIEPADESDVIIDHDRLFVVAVQRSFLRVQGALDSRVSGELVAHLAYVASRWAKERQRRSGPGEYAHVHALGELGEEVAKHDLLTIAYECEVR